MPKPLGERACACVHAHTPRADPLDLEAHHVWPKGKGGPDVAANERWLCAGTHNEVHRYWRLMERYDGTPPGWIRRRFRSYVRQLVHDGWAQMRAERPTPGTG